MTQDPRLRPARARSSRPEEKYLFGVCSKIPVAASLETEDYDSTADRSPLKMWSSS
jgi:hypothetical protein